MQMLRLLNLVKNGSKVEDLIFRTVIEGVVLDITPKFLSDLLDIPCKGRLIPKDEFKRKVLKVAFGSEEVDTLFDKNKKRTGEIMFHLHTLTSKGINL